MTAGKLTGSASISFEQPIYIESAASITGKKEGEGPLGHLFDMVSQDPLWNKNMGNSRKHSSEGNRCSGCRKGRTDSPGHPHGLCR